MSILTEAEGIVNGARQADYNDPVQNFELIAALSTFMTGKEFTAKDCCMVLMAVKLSREAFKHKRDNLVDLCGYCEILERLNARQTE